MLNSVFLYHATQAGLDLAIVNTEKLERYAEIPEDESAGWPKRWSSSPAGDRAAGESAVAAFPRTSAARGAARTRRAAHARRDLPLDERLARAIVEGTQGGARGRPRRGARRPARPSRSTSSTAR